MKNLKYIRVLLLIFVLCIDQYIHANYIKRSAVSYQLNGGRFGDNLKSFTQAYWLAYLYDLVFLYVPFPGSESLTMHDLLSHGTSDLLSTYDKTYVFERYDPVIVTDLEETMYVTTFYSNTHIDWKDEAFVQKLKHMVSPRNHLNIPHGIRNGIALHIRRGGGFSVDTDRVRKRRPAHFPHVSYYAQALDYLLSIVDGTYTVYLFTDDRNPELLAAEIMQQLEHTHTARINIQYRKDHNSYNSYVLDDFFSMCEAQYLIRPKSNFSLYAQRLGNHVITISPACAKQGNPWGIIESILVHYKHTQHEISLVEQVCLHK